MGRPGYVTVPILSVLATIGYVYYTTVFLAIPAWLGLSTAAGVANAAAFTALAAACLATYAVAVSRARPGPRAGGLRARRRGRRPPHPRDQAQGL
ncbi:hypothetical protein PR202_ga09074 [Eleusine coracana subsp. coracana]|uniref:Uncharacterized protein n=1 Tax=Eleusine coracana subsp. coracana TaxID=191504 RepID=A0AAV5C1W4_ELECO|nr:hypothetical protein PR202_ga09074 [Eleusine coracana subsp. coracana]